MHYKLFAGDWEVATMRTVSEEYVVVLRMALATANGIIGYLRIDIKILENELMRMTERAEYYRGQLEKKDHHEQTNE